MSGSDSSADAGNPAPVMASGSGPEARNAHASAPGSNAATPVGEESTGVRRGLPRESGGAPWPPASAVPPPSAQPAAAEEENRAGIEDVEPARAMSVSAPDSGADAETPAPATVNGTDSGVQAGTAARSGETVAASAASIDAHEVSPAASANDAVASPRPPLTVPRTVWPGAAARHRATPPALAQKRPTAPPRAGAQTRLADFSPVQLLGSTAVLGVFALALVGIAVLIARFVLAIGPGRDFLAAFPGEYHLPASAPVGLPAWLNWSHFLNSFFLLLIIRTGWQVRREKRPAAFWSPRNNRKRRISLALWFHQALDILWIANGVVFVVLLFVTGQWMRIVPTSWEVFPNALSAALQYASLDWPTENGWVNYNSLQQLSYFAITFVAAPLAIISGVRLSGVWPKDAERLNKLYPAEWARKVHFPTMLFFVAFIVVHVALVLATGALRNLNHMYAARGSEDPTAYTSDPTGLLIFAASLVVMAAAWVAARPAVLVPIARLFGEVKQR
ncbi:cytochrome b/b6 domain-containing protein [Microbacterium sp. SL62]|uniref:cytochrome b/b6 domain-containing protein n=1 Tax=Microbacterium sp. SL62 TaxID=2995139 RepID=UPI002DD442DE|nr:cytochrome b/b6 domain-containing protein [Microbacterium sp. SL62]